MVNNLSETNSIVNHFLTELRDLEIQKDRARFRKNIERIGEILAYEISKSLDYEKKPVVTPLAITSTYQLKSYPVLATILRAGLPLLDGFSRFFDHSDCAFVGAYRGPHKSDFSFEVETDYVSTPKLEDKTLIIIDPMLATGKSIISAYASLLNYGRPAKIYIASVIAAPEGIALLEKKIPGVEIWVGAIDEKLNSKYYILPGLGDAGDLSFGNKV